MAYIGMAYIAMAYTAMAYIVMAYVIMAYVVMALAPVPDANNALNPMAAAHSPFTAHLGACRRPTPMACAGLNAPADVSRRDLFRRHPLSPSPSAMP